MDQAVFGPYWNLYTKILGKTSLLCDENFVFLIKLYFDRYIWSLLSTTATIGINSESTRIGALLSSPLVTMACCLLLCNTGVLPTSSPVYTAVLKYLVPLAIPLLLFDADLKKCIRVTGTLLRTFVIGSFGTIFGTFVAYALVPMRELASGRKIAAALCARHVSEVFSKAKHTYIGKLDYGYILMTIDWRCRKLCRIIRADSNRSRNCCSGLGC